MSCRKVLISTVTEALEKSLEVSQCKHANPAEQLIIFNVLLQSTAVLDMNPGADTDLQFIACGDTSARAGVDKTSLAAEHVLRNTTDSAMTTVNDNQHVSQLRAEPIPCHTNTEAVKGAEPEGAASTEVSDHSTAKKPILATMQVQSEVLCVHVVGYSASLRHVQHQCNFIFCRTQLT